MMTKRQATTWSATDTACPPRHRLVVRCVTGAIDLSIPPLSSEVRACSPEQVPLAATLHP